MSESEETEAKDIVFRQATTADATGIARAHAEGWQWGYRGLLPDAFLDGLTERSRLDRREAFWRDLLAEQPPVHPTWVAERDGRILGLCQVGPSRDSDATREIGEVGGLYLVREAAGKGIGRRLFAAAIEGLKTSGYAEATLWVLTTNQRARRFYEAAGWRPDGSEKTEEGPGFPLPQVRYRARLRRDRDGVYIC